MISTCTHEERDLILKQQQANRSKCLVYTRVMGYHRPVESFNIGKKGEHQQRTQFKYRNEQTGI